MKTLRFIQGLIVLSILFFSSVETQAQPLFDGKTMVEEKMDFIRLNTPKSYLINQDGGFVTLDFTALKFPFVLDGVVTTKARIQADGVIRMEDKYTAYNLVPTRYPLTIAALSEDLYTNAGGVKLAFAGTAPNRILIIQWDGVRYWNEQFADGKNMQLEVLLFEGSNEIQIRYADMKNVGSKIATGDNNSCGFITGSAVDRYVNIEPGAPATFHYSNDKANIVKHYTEDAAEHLADGTTYILEVPSPRLLDCTPKDKSIWTVGNPYPAPKVLLKRRASYADLTLSYKIYKASNKKVIYEATVEGDVTKTVITPNPQPVGIGKIYDFTHGTGLTAKADPAAINSAVNDGSIFLVEGNKIEGGEYIAEATMTVPSENITQTVKKKIIIAMENDIAITNILAPRDKDRTKYVMNSVVPIEIKVTNVGLQPVSSIKVTTSIYNNATNQIVYGPMTETWNNAALPIKTGEFATVSFPSLKTNAPKIQPGLYKIKFHADLIGADDVALANNDMPAVGEDYIFEVLNDVDIAVNEVVAPAGNVYIGRPINPKIKFTNHGIDDLADIPVDIKITDPNKQLVYSKTLAIESLQTGFFNTAVQIFTESFIPTVKGTYTIAVDVKNPQDKVMANNKLTSTFTVIGSMKGNFTIGNSVAGANNFPTFESAMDAIYQRGIDGPVVFELTDAVYNLGDVADKVNPALDLSSRIVGVNKTNTITFKPSQARAITEGGITLNLNSGSGIGVFIGQSILPMNDNAPVQVVGKNQKRDFANTQGYFIFDGGSQKALRFVMNSDADFRAAIYLGSGASNNTIKNCLIEGGSKPSFLSSIPLTAYSPARSSFIFENDKRSAGVAYTAGIVMRSVAPRDSKTESNFFNLDTATNNNNTIEFNKISNFAFGVASMGTGVLYKAGGTNKNISYYNEGNTISNNTIFDVARAGIFVGFERNSNITNNRIYNVISKDDKNVAGIMVGGQADRGMFGYNAIGLKIKANEISNLKSNKNVAGIRIEQSGNLLPDGGISRLYPTVNENIIVASNLIWGLEATDKDASKYGVRIFTERNTANNFMVAKYNNYNSRNDKIVNNTIVMNGDDNMKNTSVIAAIGLQQTRNSVVKNNAIAMLDNSIDTKCVANAAIFVQNPKAATSGLISDRNVFELSNAATIARFVETDAVNNTLANGFVSEYKNLKQWQNWINQDMNSVEGPFMKDYTFVNANPRNYRIVSSPSYPLGSLLNNRGDIANNNSVDLLGTSRGIAGQRFDIGAIEFNGRMSIDDVEAVAIIEPAAYKANDGMFADAEYVMTTPDIEVITRLRNNGSLFQTATEATLKIYMETPQGTFTTPIVSKKVSFDLIASESIDINFNIVKGKNFKPKTYSALRNVPAYVAAVPAQFKHMTANVTPRYKFEVVLENDENYSNNVISKVVRFYVRQSWLHMLVSSEHIGATIAADSPKNTIAGKLNHDALVDGLGSIGWKVDFSTNNIEKDRFDFDVIDRNCWEARGFDYSIYRSLLWSDGHDVSTVGGKDVNNTLPRQQQLDITKYLASGKVGDKKSLIIASQEMTRNNDKAFAGNILRTINRPVATPDEIDYKSITGESIGRNLKTSIKATAFTGDVAPTPALVNMDKSGDGRVKLAYYYSSVKPGATAIPKLEKIMGVATSTIGSNRAYLGTDWRHFGDIEQILRQLFDYVETNGGIVFAVELVDFNANAIGNRVNLTWETASEENSSTFEIERSEVSEAGNGIFTSISEVSAAGNSGSTRNYNTTDVNVEMGKSYIYRLKMVDTDGSFQYSDERLVELGSNATMVLSTVSPNPVNTVSNFTMTLTENTEVELSLFDMTGTKVIGFVNTAKAAGLYNYSINASNLSSGSYTLVLRTNNAVITRTVTVVK